ncbi:hypothetical protein GQ54DRAFT_58656 [Martensiomyces pterosporus]|nr:hypothetical protein GQ54DRAFT_58656 [Martensiomyces pterosporus]
MLPVYMSDGKRSAGLPNLLVCEPLWLHLKPTHTAEVTRVLNKGASCSLRKSKAEVLVSRGSELPETRLTCCPGHSPSSQWVVHSAKPNVLLNNGRSEGKSKSHTSPLHGFAYFSLALAGGPQLPAQIHSGFGAPGTACQSAWSYGDTGEICAYLCAPLARLFPCMPGAAAPVMSSLRLQETNKTDVLLRCATIGRGTTQGRS